MYEDLTKKVINPDHKTFLSKHEIEAAINTVLKQINLNIKFFDNLYPAPATSQGIYRKITNTEWTNGFWTGILWLAFQYSQDPKYKRIAEKNVDSFEKRISQKIAVNHHDLGFLYTTSVVSDFKITGSENARQIALKAADCLVSRFQPNGGFIQAWGDLNDNNEYRLIIDSLMNIPLLYWAEQVTRNSKYGKIADQHYQNVINTVIRDNGSTYHTYYFDKQNGRPLKGMTKQGYSDDSSWARGQAWAVYGIPLHYKYRHKQEDFKLFRGVTNYFLNRLPKDFIPYWDLIFNDGDNQPKDSSSGAIAICGIAEMLKHLPESFSNKYEYVLLLHKMLRSLIDNYANNDLKPGAPLLNHGVYSWHSGKGVDEGNIWGDYFYFEALMRFYEDWKVFW